MWPNGVYDVAANDGWVNVGSTADPAEFAVQSIRLWRERIGCARYPAATELTITADGGGSNGSRVRLWKVELQKLKIHDRDAVFDARLDCERGGERRLSNSAFG